jgi:DNA repair protein RecN (Recombination protein N)
MLLKLHISNYAIIQEIIIDFSGMLNIITGETGAGKSILMGALSLILGERADSNALLNKEKKCVVEGFFKIEQYKAVKDFLLQHELDAADELVVRREIAVNGKSRAFINDTPVTVAQLQQLSNMLVNLHRQFDTLELGETNFQREVIDALAGNEKLLDAYVIIYRKWHQAKSRLQQLQTQQAQFTKELDYNTFLYNELAEANFKDNELEELEAELKLQSNAEGIKSTLSKVYFELQESEHPLVQQLKQFFNQLGSYADYHPNLPVLLQRLQASQVELSDIADELDTIGSKINHDPQRIEFINQRTGLGYKLLKKHGLQTTAALLQLQQQLEQKIASVLKIDDAIALTEKEMAQELAKAQELAQKITAARQKQLAPLVAQVNKLLAQVGMPNARLQVNVNVATQLNVYGADDISFLFDANKSGQFAPVNKVASGGELSRLMLCIKSLVAKRIHLPTLIFDEIDTGISGEAARQVGIILKDLANTHQVICITHQPQIAGKANAHFFVYKTIENDAVRTSIRRLTQDERITAIAQMLSGEKPTAAALENAREMVMN